MKRRELLTTMVATGLGVPAFAAQEHDHEQVSGPSPRPPSASVRGHKPTIRMPWPSNRFTTPLALPAPNVHALMPYEAKVKAGGTVNFIVAGFHLIAVYAPGITLDDIDVTLLAAPLPVPPGPASGATVDQLPERPGLLRLDPRQGASCRATLHPPAALHRRRIQDRVEVVQFPAPGRHLVICAVLPHFAPANNAHPPMHGWVTRACARSRQRRRPGHTCRPLSSG